MENYSIIEVIVIALMGMWASILSNQNIAVYHDGLRPIMGEYISGRMKKKEFVGLTFAMSFGLIVGFGIPFSLTSQIILIHTLLLATDLIGIASPNKYIAGLLGALYGAGIVLGLGAVVSFFEGMPVNIMDGMGMIGDPVTTAYSCLGALAVAYQFGMKDGIITLIATLLTRVLVARFNPITIGNASVNLSKDGLSLAVGMIMLLAFCIMKSKGANQQSSVSTSNNPLFTDNAKKIRKNIIPLAIMGAFISFTASMHYTAGGPLAITLLADGQVKDAAAVSFLGAIGYLPLVVTTGLISGVWASGGICDWLFGLGFLSSPPVAAVLGAAGMSAEVIGVKYLAKFLDKYPEIRASGDHIRTAMTQLLEISLLVGSMNAANAMAPSFGFFFVGGMYLLNIIAGEKVTKMAVGPLAAILVGLLINLFAIMGLYIPA